MGDAADMLLDGIVDWDGTYDPTQEETGYPRDAVVGKGNRPENPTDKNRLNGVVGWLEGNSRIKLPKNSALGSGWQQVVFRYGKDIYGITNQRLIIKEISGNFGKFVNWVMENYRV